MADPSPPKEELVERRRFYRLSVDLPMEFWARVPESKEVMSGQGVLKNISTGGAYFTCTEPLPWECGRIWHFVITSTPTLPDFPDPTYFIALGRVVRLDSPGMDCHYFGVALEFLSPLTLLP